MTLDSINICSVWEALGGGELRRSRGRAFWRNGDSYSVTVDATKNCWYDFRDSTGGGVLSLVMVATGCTKREALRWLQENAGLDRQSGKRDGSRDDRRAARRWASTAEALADILLETMDTEDPERFAVTEIRRIARAGGRELLDEFRDWSEKYPDLTAGMIYAGGEHEKRIQRQLALFIEEMAKDAG